jgi:hypothetical protein
MNDIEHDISHALRQLGASIETRPDTHDLTQRVHRRRRRRRIRLTGGAVAAVLVVAIGTFAATRLSPSTPAAPVVLDDCSPLTHLPFRPSYLPPGTPEPNLFQPGHVAWMVPGGIIEIWHEGGDNPQPDDTATMTVLGRPALIGSISDGYSVVFNLGTDDAACSEWALVAHPGTTINELAQVAAALVPNR